MSISLTTPIDRATYRHVLGHYPTGVCVITAVEPDAGPTGMVVGSFTSVSLDPPLIGFLPDKSSTTWPRIERAGRFCVNVLSRHQRDLCRKFSAKGGDKFAGLAHRITPNGSPVLDGVVAWIDCGLHATYEAGDHLIVLGEVRELEAMPGEPLIFLRGGYGDFTIMPEPS